MTSQRRVELQRLAEHESEIVGAAPSEFRTVRGTRCVVCGDDIVQSRVTRNPRKYCSVRCTSAARRQRAKVRQTGRVLDCPRCGHNLARHYGDASQCCVAIITPGELCGCKCRGNGGNRAYVEG